MQHSYNPIVTYIILDVAQVIHHVPDIHIVCFDLFASLTDVSTLRLVLHLTNNFFNNLVNRVAGYIYSLFVLIAHKAPLETQGQIMGHRKTGARINGSGGGGGRKGGKNGRGEESCFPSSPFSRCPPPPLPSFLLSPQFSLHPTICPWVSEDADTKWLTNILQIS